MEQPGPHQSHSFLPQRCPLQAAARTVNFGDENSICNYNVPTTVWTIPALNPLPDQEASSSTNFHRERYSPDPAPEPAAPTPSTPGSFWNPCGEAEALRRRAPLPTASCWAPPWHPEPFPTLPSFPSFSRVPLGSREPLSQERAEEARVSLQAPRSEAWAPGATKTPFSAATSGQGSSRGGLSPHRSLLHALVQAPLGLSARRVPGSRCQGARPFSTNTPTHTHTPLHAAGQGVAQGQEHSIRRVGAPVLTPHRPGLELGQAGCGAFRPGVQASFTRPVIRCPGG